MCARALDAAAAPFVNYLGSCGGGLLGPRWMGWWFDRAAEAGLVRGMHYPVRRNLFFAPRMTPADVSSRRAT
ncbi:hypothetical protein GCM10027445_24140 [Amycolatopsis endophytica]|uniref:Uncharacterized protein n=1 Tax=Amycolatopsis endophytica TaxID=860233 RepID=A0A853BGB1_9PSEU|nr:hypothetical protein [Amycolatopsis endophytica]